MNVLSTRLLYFERRDDGRLKPPQEYPANAVAAVTTHDLPTLAGFWQGLDIDLRERRHLFPDEEARNRQIVERAADRARLLVALESEGLLPPGSGLIRLVPGNDGGACRSGIHLSCAGAVQAAADADGGRLWRARAAKPAGCGRPGCLPQLAAQAATQS